MAEGEQLTIFSRVGCHLCEQMEQELAGLVHEFQLELQLVDIDGDPALADRYNDLVPVLMHGDRELARYRLDTAAVRAYLTEIR